MLGEIRLFAIITTASVATTFVNLGLTLAFSRLVQKPSKVMEGVCIIFTLILPIAAAAWWVFRRLRSDYPYREARAVTFAFAVFAPVSLGVGMLTGQLSGGYAESVLGTRFALAGAVAGVIVVSVLGTFIAALLALRVTRGDELL